MDSHFLESWEEFLEVLEDWWDDCSSFASDPHHRPNRWLWEIATDIAAWCYDKTNVNPTKLTDLTVYIKSHFPAVKYNNMPAPVARDRIKRQLERCASDVAYLRACALRELGADDATEILDRNAARNKWLYEQRLQGKSLELIEMDLQSHTEWNQIRSPQGIGRAIDTYCRKNKLAPIRTSETK